MKSGCNEGHLRTNTLVQCCFHFSPIFLGKNMCFFFVFYCLEQLSQDKKTKGSRNFFFVVVVVRIDFSDLKWFVVEWAVWVLQNTNGLESEAKFFGSSNSWQKLEFTVRETHSWSWEWLGREKLYKRTEKELLSKSCRNNCVGNSRFTEKSLFSFILLRENDEVRRVLPSLHCNHKYWNRNTNTITKVFSQKVLESMSF